MTHVALGIFSPNVVFAAANLVHVVATKSR